MNDKSVYFPGNSIYINENFLTAQECEDFLQLIESYRKLYPIPHVCRQLRDRSLNYKVIDGEKISLHLPDIHQLYQKVNQLLNQNSNQKLAPLANIRVGCNINITQPGGEYRWHYDRNLITGILYLNDVDGGETECYPNYRIYLQHFRHSFVQKILDSILPGQCEVLKEDSSWSKPMDLKKAPYSAHNVRNRSKLVN
jgi:hypothetical protein